MKKAIAKYLQIPQTAVLKFRQEGDVMYVILTDFRKMRIPATAVNPIMPIPTTEPAAIKPAEATVTPDTIAEMDVMFYIPPNSSLHTVFNTLNIRTMSDLAEKSHRLNRTALRKVGLALNIPGAAKMNKIPLVKAVKEYCR